MSPRKVKRSNSTSSDDGSTTGLPYPVGFNYRLPQKTFEEVVLDPDLALSRQQNRPFSAGSLATGLSSGCSALAIKSYLQSYPRHEVIQGLDTLVGQHRIIIYAIERNSPECLETLIEYGAKPKAKDFGKVPVLAFAIMRTKWTVRNATEVVKVLLSHGADYRCIPEGTWIDYVSTPSPETDYKQDKISFRKRTEWCTPECRAILAETLNLTVRYYLWRASRVKPSTARTLQIARAHKMTNLLKLPFQIVGQELATTLVLQNVYTHIALNTRKPLVFAFAGLSGHGKTELATQMGSLLNVPTIDLDCAQMGQLEGLLGPTSPYRGYEEGSPLNNHVAGHTGKRSVVFLDEFDKTDKEVRNSLLKVMDTGMYRDRRNNLEVDASQVIWILATNLGDKSIERYHSKHIADRKDAEIDKISIEPLRKELFKLFLDIFSPAIAGRINVIAPSFPFSVNEQAVVARKFLHNLQDEGRQAIDLEEPQLRYIGRSHIAVHDDGRFCQHLAENGYVKNLGARSIGNAVGNVRRMFATVFSNEAEEVHETMNEEPLVKYSLQLRPVSEVEDKVAVVKDGVTVL